MNIDLKHRIPGKTCTFIRLDDEAVCGQPACHEFAPMPVAGPNGVVEFLPGARFAYLCMEHTARWLMELELTGNVTFSSKIAGGFDAR